MVLPHHLITCPSDTPPTQCGHKQEPAVECSGPLAPSPSTARAQVDIVSKVFNLMDLDRVWGEGAILDCTSNVAECCLCFAELLQHEYLLCATDIVDQEMLCLRHSACGTLQLLHLCFKGDHSLLQQQDLS
eukprot:3594022-Rhodomonas_salina.1